jgi:hypothetical protein
VDASVKLAKDLNINQTPTLLVNGRQVPANAPYDTIKQIVEYQEKLDGSRLLGRLLGPPSFVSPWRTNRVRKGFAGPEGLFSILWGSARVVRFSAR